MFMVLLAAVKRQSQPSVIEQPFLTPSWIHTASLVPWSLTPAESSVQWVAPAGTAQDLPHWLGTKIN